MNNEELVETLQQLCLMPGETEWIEFKEAKTSYDFNKLGQYFSALSNEANLKGKPYGWLVFGIEDKHKSIVGTAYRNSKNALEALKLEIANRTINRITFIEIYELRLPKGRVIMFQIPAAPMGIPTSWDGHYYGRDGESIGPLSIYELEQIRKQGSQYDWSAGICHNATMDDLSVDAISKARLEYKNKHPKFAEEVDQWDDITFLNKAKVLINGKITRAAILLLGKSEADYHLAPAVAQISWILKDTANIEVDYEHFGPPFLLSVNEVLLKVRNLKYRYLPNNTLFPTEVTQYDSYVIREALHNCIAHQDYSLRGKVILVEKPDELIFVNRGVFIPRSVEAVISQDAPQEYYRNKFLADAMVNLNMIDTIGSGIKKMFLLQRRRFFPMPSFDLSNPELVKVSIMGKIMDPQYTQVLIENTELSLETVIALDKVQKKIKLTDREFKDLKAQKLIEGRFPNLFVAAKIAVITGEKSAYIKNRAFDDKHYKKMVLAYIGEYGSASRNDIDDLLLDKLSDILGEEQKRNKIRNLLYSMSKRDKTIKNDGTGRTPKWVLVN